MHADGNPARGRVLAGNAAGYGRQRDIPRTHDEALADTAFAAGLLGLLVELITIAGSELHGLIPDSRFWNALPLLLVIPPAVLLGTLLAPNGTPALRLSWARLALLGLVGFASYAATLGVGLLASALAHAT